VTLSLGPRNQSRVSVPIHASNAQRDAIRVKGTENPRFGLKCIYSVHAREQGMWTRP